MKRVISLFLVMLILGTIFAVFAAGYLDGNNTGYNFDIVGGKAVITGYTGNSSSLSIPSSVKYNNTNYSVTKIGDYAFAGRSSIITSLTLPSTLTEIGEGAFSTTNNIYSSSMSNTTLTIPANVTKIGARAFHSWVKLKTLTFASGSKCTTIGKYAFRNCQALSSVTLR